MIYNKPPSLYSYDVYIPTRNSIKWIGIFLNRYRQLGIEPLYIVDERSVDETLFFLQDSNARMVTFLPRDNFAEAGMIEFASNFLRKDWVLRIDDDEFPSLNMLKWLDYISQNSRYDAWSISRRDVSLNNGRFVYSNWPTRKVFDGNCYIHNPQLRFYRSAAVSYIERLHTPGFEVSGPQGIAPSNVYFIHCNNILRTPNERLDKIRFYASKDPELSWKLADESLPEITICQIHSFSEFGLDEFDSIFSQLSLPKKNEEIRLTQQEINELNKQISIWLNDCLLVYQEGYLNSMKLLDDVSFANRYGLLILPLIFVKALAELFSTINNYFPNKRFQVLSSLFWSINTFKKLRVRKANHI